MGTGGQTHRGHFMDTAPVNRLTDNHLASGLFGQTSPVGGKLDETVLLQANNFGRERVLIEVDLNWTILNGCPSASNPVGHRVLLTVRAELKSVVAVVQANDLGVVTHSTGHDQLALRTSTQRLEVIQGERRQFVKPLDPSLLTGEKNTIRNRVHHLSQRCNVPALLGGLLTKLTDHSIPGRYNVEQDHQHKHHNQDPNETSQSAPSLEGPV